MIERNLLRGLLLLTAIVGLGQNAKAEIIPSARRTGWDPGIPGGIPKRTVIFTNMAPGSSRAALQAALYACPSNQVVQLAEGSYDLSGYLMIPSYVTLRGMGSNTIINMSSGGNGGAAIAWGMYNFSPWPSGAAYANITGGANAGSTSITVSTTANLAPGNYFVVNQLNDTSFVTPTNEYLPPSDYCGGCGDGSPGSEDRLMGQILEVTSVSGNTVNFNPPLYYTYNPSLQPRCVPFANNFGAPAGKALCKWAGLESVHLYAVNGAGYGYNLVMNEAAYCWIKDVESDFAEGDHAMLNWSFRCEVRDSYFHDGFSHGPGTHDDALKLGYKTTATLVENNLFWRMHTSFIGNYGCAGNVIAYNFSTNTYHSPSPGWQIMDINFHNAHPSFNLFEGNIGVHWEPDSLHGSSSHSTVLRNWFSGINYYAPPADARGPIQWGSGYYETGAAGGFIVDYLSKYNNLVGNVGGCARVAQTGGNYLGISPGSRGNPVCYSFGYDSSMNPRDNGETFAATLFHGNYDFVTGTQHWDSTISDHSIPTSYYLSGKPTWFGNCPWPPIDPANPSALAITNLPAGYRYFFGSLPPSGPPSTNPPAITGQPQSQTVAVGDPATFAVTASGYPTSYSWLRNGAAISGANSASYTKANCQTNDSGSSYRVIASNPYGSVTSSVATLTVTNPPPGTIYIWPLGDSITRGFNQPGSYRLPLYQALTNAGMNPIFVGSTNDYPVAGLPTCNHDGWAGWEIGDLAANVPTWLTTFHKPDCVLLLIGLNDFRHNNDVAHATNRLESLIVEIATNVPTAKIVVADLNPWQNLQPTNDVMNIYYNPFIPGVVARQAGLGRNVTFCDMRGKIFPSDLQSDNTHPTAGGDAKLAQNWLWTFLGTRPDAPQNFRIVGQ